MAESRYTSLRRKPEGPKSTNFQSFWAEMTSFSVSQIEYHKEEYFKISRRVFKGLMNWYSEVRQTNDESEAWAKPIMKSMDEMFIHMINLTKHHNINLEKCTDFCKNEQDMQWINAWGKTYMNELYDDFENQIRLTNEKFDKII